MIKTFTSVDMAAAYDSYAQTPCISTGIPALDSAIAGGLAVGQVTTLLGGTGVGKSEVARQIRSHALKTGHPVVHVDVELGPQQIYIRDLAQRAQVPSSVIQRKLMSAAELERVNEARPSLHDRKLLVMLQPDQSDPPRILKAGIEKALAAFDSRKPALVILDSIQRLADGIGHDNDRVCVQRFCRWAEAFAHTHNAAVLATSELSRGEDGSDPTPDKARGAESRALEYISHVQLMLFGEGRVTNRDAIDATEEHVKVVRILVRKARDGSEGWVKTDLHLVAPYWDMRLASSGDINDTLLCRCAGQLEDGRTYSLHELTVVWAMTAKRAKQVRDGLVESGILCKHGHNWQCEKSENLVDQKDDLV